MHAGTPLLQRWWLGALVVSVGLGCGEPQPPIIGPTLIRNGSFESGKLDPWWTWAESKESTATATAAAADAGSFGLELHKATGGWGSMVGQDTEPHTPGQTFQIQARLKGAKGGERVNFNFHGQSVDVVAEDRWRTVKQLVLLPEPTEDNAARISVTTDESTVYLDDISFAVAQVARGDADEEEANLLRNGSFESGMGLWTFWTDAESEATGSTSPDARRSGYAGLVLSKGASGAGVTVKQQLPEPLAEREAYHLEADVRGTLGTEGVNMCLQINREPWSGPCVFVTATPEWQHVSETLSIDPELIDERAGVLVSLVTEGTALVDDVILTRTEAER